MAELEVDLAASREANQPVRRRWTSEPLTVRGAGLRPRSDGASH